MNKGFVALTITLSVTGMLFTLVTLSSIDTALFYDQVLKKEYRTMNYYYAYDCIDQAILKLSQDYFFSVTTPLSIPYFNCSVLSIDVEGNKRTIYTRGDYEKAYVYRSAKINLKDHSLVVLNIR